MLFTTSPKQGGRLGFIVLVRYATERGVLMSSFNGVSLSEKTMEYISSPRSTKTDVEILIQVATIQDRNSQSKDPNDWGCSYAELRKFLKRNWMTCHQRIRLMSKMKQLIQKRAADRTVRLFIWDPKIKD